MITKIDQTKCLGCGRCVEACPMDIIRLNEHRKAYIAYNDDCMTCFRCELVCTQGAIYVHPFKEFFPRVLPHIY